MPENQRRDVTQAIWDKLNARLRQFVRWRVDTDADVDDILQTVYLRIHQKVNQLRQIDRLDAWVFQITRNAVTDHYRQRRSGINTTECFDDYMTASDTDDTPLSFACCIQTMIGRLLIGQQRAITLYELDETSQKDIAKLESISLSGAKSRVQRGRKSLEKMLRECCEFQLDRLGNIIDATPNRAACCEGDAACA